MKEISRGRALGLVGFAYVIALGCGIVILAVTHQWHPILQIFLADVGATVVIYCLSCIVHNASLYDPYWSVAPFWIGIFWMRHFQITPPIDIRILLVMILVILWGVRLTWNWARDWTGFQQEDWRYAQYRLLFPKVFWLVNFGGIQLAPTVWVFLGCLPFYYIFRPNMFSFNWLNWIVFGFTIMAIVLETTADEQLRHFLRTSTDPLQIMNQHLWKWSRHPNYLGEICFWWGIFLFGITANGISALWTIIGPIAITCLFMGISIPLLEKRERRKKPAYHEYMKRTSKLLLWFPKP